MKWTVFLLCKLFTCHTTASFLHRQHRTAVQTHAEGFVYLKKSRRVFKRRGGGDTKTSGVSRERPVDAFSLFTEPTDASDDLRTQLAVNLSLTYDFEITASACLK